MWGADAEWARAVLISAIAYESWSSSSSRGRGVRRLSVAIQPESRLAPELDRQAWARPGGPTCSSTLTPPPPPPPGQAHQGRQGRAAASGPPQPNGHQQARRPASAIHHRPVATAIGRTPVTPSAIATVIRVTVA